MNQRSCARLLAIGYSQTAAAEHLSLALRTVQKWCSNPDFDDYVQDLHARAWQRIEPQMMANVELAILVQRDMLTGKVKADDKRYLEARRLIDRILDRLLYAEPAASTSPDSPPDATGTLANRYVPATIEQAP